MIKITELASKLRHIIVSGESLINLLDFEKMLEANIHREIAAEEYSIVPFYVQDGKRMELYQYEILVSSKYDFDDYILKLTGKKNICDISDDIASLRKMCFAKASDTDKLQEYLNFLINNQTLRKEVKSVFGRFEVSNLFLAIY